MEIKIVEFIDHFISLNSNIFEKLMNPSIEKMYNILIFEKAYYKEFNILLYGY